jgi:uncharacterized repeat protein (TIGR01451 family)
MEQRLQVKLRPKGDVGFLPPATVSFSVGPKLREGRQDEPLVGSVRQPDPAPVVGAHRRADPAPLAAVPRPQILLKTSCPETVAVGEPAVFQIVVTNNGDVSATGLVLRAHLAPGLEHPQGSEIEADLKPLAPGQTRKITLRTRAVRPGTQQSETIITGKGPPVRARATVVVTDPGPHLGLDGPGRALLDRPVEYQIEVVSPGAAGVRISDTLPPGLEFVSAANGGIYDPSAHQVSWVVDRLSAGQAQRIGFKAMARVPGDWTNQVTAVCGGKQMKSESVLHIEGLAALSLEVASVNRRDQQVEVGAATAYEIRVSNQGTQAGTGLQVVATVPEQMDPLGGEGPTAYQIRGRQVVFEPLDRLEAGRDARYQVRVRCRAKGDCRFQAQVTSDQLQQPLGKEESTYVY